MFRGYSEFFALTGEVIREAIYDYIDYKRAQITLWKYQKKLVSCTSCGIANQNELEAIATVSEHEEILRNKRAMKIRIKNSKKTA